jgi:predicted nucleic acid-binding protein
MPLTHIYYSWRPNLRDESDNHLVELAVAGGATAIVTLNIRDLQNAELRFPGIGILRPKELLKE